jgi:hypothetical protein
VLLACMLGSVAAKAENVQKILLMLKIRLI